MGWYVSRDGLGAISGLFRFANPDAAEFLDDANQELIDFLAAIEDAKQAEVDQRAERIQIRQAASAAIDEIDADLALIPGATTADLKQILGRCLQRQRQIIRYLRFQKG